jgi:hypothetical protein
MGHAWRKWSGLLLTVVWMTARLVLPLQAHCPHHATVETTAATNAPAPLVIPAAHHASHAGHDAAPLPQHSGAPHESAPAPCECAAQCCAATPVAVDTALVSSIPLPPLLQRTIPVLAQQATLPREHSRSLQPPATAPPTDSDLG